MKDLRLNVETARMRACRLRSRWLTRYWSVLATMRPSYKFLAYIQHQRGVKVNPDLLGDDRPERLSAFHEGEARWLAGGD